MAHPIITTLPAAPTRSMSQTEFTNTADAFLSALPDFGTEQNTLADWVEGQATITEGHVNQTLSNANAAAISASASAASASEAGAYLTSTQSLANFKGRWVDASGAATIGSSYSHEGLTWRVEVAIVNITISEPSESNSDWYLIDDIKLSNVRKSVLDNPLVSLFHPNQPVRTLYNYLTVSRASIATHVDRYGAVRTADIDELREGVDGFLIEGASTNELLYSEDFSNAAWSKTGLAVSADGIDEDASNGTHFIQQTVTQVIGKTYTVQAECFAKERRYLWSGIAGISNSAVIFDLETGAIVTAGVDAINPTIESIGGGKFVVSYSYVCTSVGNNRPQFAISIDAAGTISYQGVAGFGIGIDRIQLEEQPFATSYIPTTTTAVTRAADRVNIPVINNVMEPSLSNYTISFKVKLRNNGTTQRILTSRTLGNSNSLFYAIVTSAGSIQFRACSSQSVSATGADVYVGGVHAVFTYNNGVGTVYINGVQGTPINITPTDFLVLTETLEIGTDDGGSLPMYGNLLDFRIYNEALNIDEIKLIGRNNNG